MSKLSFPLCCKYFTVKRNITIAIRNKAVLIRNKVFTIRNNSTQMDVYRRTSGINRRTSELNMTQAIKTPKSLSKILKNRNRLRYFHSKVAPPIRFTPRILLKSSTNARVAWSFRLASIIKSTSWPIPRRISISGLMNSGST